jgi:ABC-type nitrate/sulfonate/bicarbonate transport system substrate-binding protein
VIGVSKGWFKNVGINATLKPSDIPQIAPQLLSGQIDVGTMCASCWVPTLDQTTDNKMFALSDTFVGSTILANPKGNFSTTGELVKQGKSFEVALKTAALQMKGKTFYFSTNPSSEPFRAYVMQVAGLSYSDFKGGTLDDVKIVELATGGRADFIQVAGGPQTVRLLKAGWKPLITAKEVFDRNDKRALKASDFFSGWAAKKSWLSANHATALRMASVLFRIMDYKVNHETQAAQIQIPYLNSLAGTSFTSADAKFLDHIIDPFWTFDAQKTFYVDKASIYYYKTSVQALIDRQVQAGVLKKTHSPDELFLSDDVWRELLSLKTHSSALMKSVSAKLKTAKGQSRTKATQYLAKANGFYAGRDYLDAFRFANAARLWLGS